MNPNGQHGYPEREGVTGPPHPEYVPDGNGTSATKSDVLKRSALLR
jgi:hypothetical protein